MLFYNEAHLPSSRICSVSYSTKLCWQGTGTQSMCGRENISRLGIYTEEESKILADKTDYQLPANLPKNLLPKFCVVYAVNVVHSCYYGR